MDKASVLAALEAHGVKADGKQNLGRLQNQLEKVKIVTAVRGASSEEIINVCIKHGIDTRRSVDRKVAKLIKLYQVSFH